MAKTIELTCKQCGKVFEKSKAEYEYFIKAGRAKDHFFCSLSCANTWLREHKDLDKYSSFRRYLSRAKFSSQQRDLKMDLDLKYLKDLWEKQDGRGGLTEWKLEKPLTSHAWNNHTQRPETASLDRIDSNKGYVKGNVRFISFMANMAKDRFTDKDVKRFCQAVVENMGAN